MNLCSSTTAMRAPSRRGTSCSTGVGSNLAMSLGSHRPKFDHDPRAELLALEFDLEVGVVEIGARHAAHRYRGDLDSAWREEVGQHVERRVGAAGVGTEEQAEVRSEEHTSELQS